jgi:hypothetical protein
MATVLPGLADEVEFAAGVGVFGRGRAASAAALGGAGENDEQDAGELVGRGLLVQHEQASRTPMAGSRAIRVPNAAGLMRRSASISKAYGRTGSSGASPAAAARTPAVRCPVACAMPGSAAVAAAMGTVSESPVVPAKRSPIRRMSRM